MHGKTLLLLALAGTGLAHMHLQYPPTLKGDNNPYTQGDPDPLLNYPYGCCGKQVPGPCKGHVGLLDTDEGKPVATWAPGQKVNFTLSGHKINTPQNNPEGGDHYGGSCQASLSVDKGKTFKVVTTWQGNCPLRSGNSDPSTQVFDLTIPADTPSGERVLFAWTWVNREKEFNMNCASVTIAGGSGNDQPENPPASSSAAAKPSATPTQAQEAPSATPSAPAEEQPSQTQPASSQPTGSAQYTLEGCTCSCPYQTWSQACACYSCKSPSKRDLASRKLLERKALEMHKRHLQNAEKLNAPVRRAEAVAFNDRPDALLSVDYSGASCHSHGNPFEMEYPNPGPDVVQGDGEYKLEPPTC